MDKYEYKLRSEQIQDYIAQKQYAKAMQVADTIDWRRVKNVSMLTTVSDLYKINRRYDVARDILLMAYDRYPGGRSIVYSLCELSIKLGEFVQAVEYYKEFVQVAPSDSGRFILKYKIYEAQEVSTEERITVLEQLKSEDYREKWAYELAYLYHRAGLAEKCVAECDELILTFGEGKYVLKAMELKKLHAPLNPVQQDRYDEWMGVKVKPVTTDAARKQLERPDLMQASTKVVPAKEVEEIRVKTVDVGNQFNTINIQEALADSMKEIMAKDEIETQKKVKAQVPPVTPAIHTEDATAFIPSQNMSEITFPGESPAAVEATQVVKEEPVSAPVQEEASPAQREPHISFANMDTAKLIQNMTQKAAITAAHTGYEGMVSMESDGQIRMVVPEEPTVEKQITGQMSIGDLVSEWEKKKTDSEQRSMDDIKKRMIRQTGRIFTDFDKSSNSGVLEGLEDVGSSLHNLPIEPAEPKPVPKSNAELFAEQLLGDDALEGEDLPEVEELAEIEEPDLDSHMTEQPLREEDYDLSTSELTLPDGALGGELEPTPEETAIMNALAVAEAEAAAAVANAATAVAETVSVAATVTETVADAVTETEDVAPKEDDFQISPDFSTAEIADVAEKLLEEAQKEAAGTPVSAPEVSNASRALTDDERELFGALIQTDQMKDQIAEAIDEITLASYTGNVIITGEAGSGTLTLAKNLIKSVQLSDGNFSGKAAKISGASLDKQDIEKTLGKLRNGALIIEKANGMSSASLQRLCAYLDADHEEGIIVILEDTKMEMRKLINKHKDMTKCFTARIDINAMDSDSLVGYAKEYAYENEYSIDEMGVLALYTRISDLQSGDHSVTLSEVREIMDESFWSANRKNLKHYFDILSGKRYDDEDMIILRERDFIC